MKWWWRGGQVALTRVLTVTCERVTGGDRFEPQVDKAQEKLELYAGEVLPLKAWLNVHGGQE